MSSLDKSAPALSAKGDSDTPFASLSSKTSMKLLGQRRTSSVLLKLTSTRVVTSLRVAWVIAVLWYELGTFFWSVAGCRWPDRVLKEDGFIGKPSHVLLVADPQVLDGQSYPGRSWLLSKLTQFIVDLNLRKSWTVASHFKPEMIVFLGDMMDNGRAATEDTEYRDYFNRFASIFTVDPSVEVHYIPGNHDIGLGNQRSFSPDSRKRYIANFGPVNHQVTFANHTFALIDAPGLVEEDYRRASSGNGFDRWSAPPGGAVDFVKKFGAAGSTDPVILFSHIPLFRPDTATCGPLREKGSIRRGVGYGYQNTLGRMTSDYLLQNLRPIAIFSGDDHDYCEYTHNMAPILGAGMEAQYVREVTVKSFSMAMGIRRPGFQLLSLASSSLIPIEKTYADAPCFLPDQLRIYTHCYVPLFMLTLIILGVSSFQKSRIVRRNRPESLDLSPLSYSTHPTFSQPNTAIWAATTPISAHGGLRSRSPSPSPGFLNARTPRTPTSPYMNANSGSNINLNANTNTNGGSLTPTYRAFNAVTPLPSPGLLSAGHPGSTVIATGGHHHDDDEDDDPMSPAAQYAPRRVSTGNAKGNYFHFTSGRHTRFKRRWTWSYAFVFRGRRRRLTLSIPQWLENTLSGGSRRGKSGKGVLLNVFFTDLLAVAWPAFIVFVLITVFMFW